MTAWLLVPRLAVSVVVLATNLQGQIQDHLGEAGSAPCRVRSCLHLRGSISLVGYDTVVADHVLD